MKFLFVGVFALLLSSASAVYNRTAVVEYAYAHWDSPNHACGTYSACTPYSYWGGEACGYPSQGGDCANFVSQCLLAGGHSYLNQGDPCRGYPCGKEEIGAQKLGRCLHDVHGWTRICGHLQAPPLSSGLKPGDVAVYHAGSCTDTNAHATIVTSVGTTIDSVLLSCHSTARWNKPYTWWTGSQPYIEWLLYPGNGTEVNPYGFCTLSSGTEGICTTTTSCASSGGTSSPGYCPGDSSIQCCTDIACGNGGSCMRTSDCDTSDHEIVSGLCPGGDSSFQCCQPASTTEVSSSSEPKVSCDVPGFNSKGTCMDNTTSCGGSSTLKAFSGICAAGYDCCVAPNKQDDGGASSDNLNGMASLGVSIVSVAAAAVAVVLF